MSWFEGATRAGRPKRRPLPRCYNREVVSSGKNSALVCLLTAIVICTSASVALSAPLSGSLNHPSLSGVHSALISPTSVKVEKSSAVRGNSIKKRNTPALVVIVDLSVASRSTNSQAESHPRASLHRYYHSVQNRAPPVTHLS